MSKPNFKDFKISYIWFTVDISFLHYHSKVIVLLNGTYYTKFTFTL